MSDYSDIFLAMGLSSTILEKAEKQSKSKKLSTIPPSNMQPSERESFLEENKDVLIATAIKYTNGEYTVAKDDHLLNVAMQIVALNERWESVGANPRAWLSENYCFPIRDNYIHAIRSPAELQRVYRSVFGPDADFRMGGKAEKYLYLEHESCCPNHFFHFLGKAKFAIAKYENWQPIMYQSYRFSYNPMEEIYNFRDRETAKIYKDNRQDWYTRPYLIKEDTFSPQIETFTSYNGDFSDYINDDKYAEPWPEREEELRGLYDQLLDEKYAIVRKGYLRGKYKEIFTKDFVLNSRNRLITMWDFAPMDYPDKPERVREMAIRYIARREGWKPTMCKTEVIPPYEWAMFVPTETGECKRFYFDGTNEFEVPYTWRDFPISNLLYWPQRIV